MDGGMRGLDSSLGKVVLVNFWASWCEPCREEHANLLRLQRMFSAYPDFAMLGVAHRDEPANAREFLRRWGAGYPHVSDADGAIGDGFGISGVPQSFLIDREGIIRCRHFGPVAGADMVKIAERWLRPLLSGHVPSCN